MRLSRDPWDNFTHFLQPLVNKNPNAGVPNATERTMSIPPSSLTKSAMYDLLTDCSTGIPNANQVGDVQRFRHLRGDPAGLIAVFFGCKMHSNEGICDQRDYAPLFTPFVARLEKTMCLRRMRVISQLMYQLLRSFSVPPSRNYFAQDKLLECLLEPHKLTDFKNCAHRSQALCVQSAACRHFSTVWTRERKLDVWALCNSEKKYGLPEEDHCASRWKGRSHLVVYLPALQQFPPGGLHLVGFDRTRRQQQQEEEALQLVVRRVWRQI